MNGESKCFGRNCKYVISCFCIYISFFFFFFIKVMLLFKFVECNGDELQVERIKCAMDVWIDLAAFTERWYLFGLDVGCFVDLRCARKVHGNRKKGDEKGTQPECWGTSNMEYDSVCVCRNQQRKRVEEKCKHEPDHYTPSTAK